MTDPTSRQGQWFIDVLSPQETPSAWELHDDDDSLCIRGQVVAITWGNPSGGHTNITGFTIEATVRNNLPLALPAGISSNSHIELQSPPVPFYRQIMKRTRLAAEFAVAEAGSFGPPWVGIVPSPTGLQPPYYPDPRSGGAYVIEAVNENLAAWYCYQEPFPAGNPPGAYYVPAWELGDIPPNQSATVTMSFAIKTLGGLSAEMPVTDIRHGVLRASYYYGHDVLYNRHDSLKISHWIDMILIDGGTLIQSYAWPEYEEEPPVEYVYASDASVFFDSAFSGEKPSLQIALTSTNQTPDEVRLSWTALDAKTYWIQYCDNLLSNTWTTVPIANPALMEIPAPMDWTDDGTVILSPPVQVQTQRFYRLISP
jgi:hypothetical protein